MRRSGDWLAILEVGWPGLACVEVPPGGRKDRGSSAATSGTDLYEVGKFRAGKAGPGRGGIEGRAWQHIRQEGDR